LKLPHKEPGVAATELPASATIAMLHITTCKTKELNTVPSSTQKTGWRGKVHGIIIINVYLRESENFAREQILKTVHHTIPKQSV
jgi:hypothetical protein